MIYQNCSKAIQNKEENKNVKRGKGLNTRQVGCSDRKRENGHVPFFALISEQHWGGKVIMQKFACFSYFSPFCNCSEIVRFPTLCKRITRRSSWKHPGLEFFKKKEEKNHLTRMNKQSWQSIALQVSSYPQYLILIHRRLSFPVREYLILSRFQIISEKLRPIPITNSIRHTSK